MVKERAGTVLAVLLVLLLGGSCSGPSQHENTPAIEFLNSPDTKALGLPFSQVVRVGKTLYLSGQLGIAPGTKGPVRGGIEDEAKQALENVKAILERNGSSMNRVVKCTVFLADIRDFSKFNEVYRAYFSSPFPARSALAASGLALGARVEIECIAVVGDE